MAKLLVTVSSLIAGLLASDAPAQSILHFSEDYPGFDGIDKNTFKCGSEVRDGTFTFDSGRGISYFALSDDMFYLEYYAPMFYWTGFASAGI